MAEKENKKETLITKLEKGRAEFAYKCVKGLINLNYEDPNQEDKKFKFFESLKWIKDFEEKVKKALEKELKNKKITEERIREILSTPVKYLGDTKKELTEEEKKIIEIYEKVLKDYRSYTRKIPQMILSNGLGQTLAYIYSKKEKGNAYDLIYKQLTDYLKSESTSRKRMPEKEPELVEWVIKLPSAEYRYVTEEILAFLKWLKRFAEGMIEGEGGE